MGINTIFENIRLALFLAYKSIIRGSRATIILMIFIMSLAFVNLVFIASILNGVIVTNNTQMGNRYFKGRTLIIDVALA